MNMFGSRWLELVNRAVLNRSFPRNVTGDVEIGEGTKVKEYSTIDGNGAKIRIGANCVLAEGVKILSLDGAKGVYMKAEILIGNNVFVGTNAIILQGVTIGDNSVIGAGAVVVAGTFIPANETWAGNPAKKISDAHR